MQTNLSHSASRALIILVSLHILIIAISNYLVQIPLQTFSFTTTWGALTFPFIFLVTDLTVRIYGKTTARKIIFWAMIPALMISYFFSVVFFEGKYVGFSGFSEFNLFVFRIVIASFTAYLLGQLLDIQVFDRLRHIGKWWFAPLASTIIGNLFDSLCFFSIAFYKSPDAFMAANWIEIGTIDYLFKMLVSIFVFLPVYGFLLAKIKQWLVHKPLSTSNALT